MDAIAAKIGCAPPLGQLREHHPALYERAVGSAFGGAQFRLVGEGNMEEAWEALREMPMPEFRRAEAGVLKSLLDSY
jgi:hypothetical protein